MRDIETLSDVPIDLSMVGTVKLGSSPTSVYAFGSYTYVGDGTSHDLKVIDVSNPFNLSTVGTLLIGLK